MLSTAPTARQVESLLWAEVNCLWRQSRAPLPGRCLNTKLEASLEQTATGLTTNELGPGKGGLSPTPHSPLPASVVLGVDVARFGDCETELALRRGAELVGIQVTHGSRRDEAYAALRDRLRDGEIRFAARWSPLTGQLCALKYGFTSRGQIQVESKDEMRRRGIASPDWADAVALALAPTQAGFCPPVAAGALRPNPLPMLSLQGSP